jgi:hypothetical protein
MSVRDLEICWGSNTLKAATWGRGLWENSLVGRKDFPAIVQTNITNPPSDELPRTNIAQYVSSSIHYTNTLSKVYLMYGEDTLLLNNKIDMALISDSTWKSIAPLPSSKTNANIYFKVFAVGSNNDTSTTYRFHYSILPSEYCNAQGLNDGGNLHINNVTISTINNNTINDTYTYFNDPILDLNKGVTYSLSITGSTTWGDNDYAAWIDFDGDKIFNPNTETVLFAPNAGGQASSTFTLPAIYNALDTFRMRVRLGYWGNTPLPCGSSLGEVEDYAVKMNWPTRVATLIKDQISISPNPAKDQLIIKLANVTNQPIIIFGISGAKVKVLPANTTKEITVDIKEFSTGTYIIKCGNSQATFVKE